MKDPEIELKRRLHKVKTGQNLTYEEFCLFEIRNLVEAEKVAPVGYNSTYGIERNILRSVKRKM